MTSDGELLRCYVENGSEAAFTELVQRHVNIVYRAALRRVGRNAHAADDVTQKVFTDLARKAKSLQHRPNLAGWLYTSTRFAAADVVRGEQRRRTYEEKAHIMHELESTPPASADRFEPFLDEVMDLLHEQDREAVILHFFEGRSFVEVGNVLSLSADATRMRVNRALERLRTAFAQHGVTSTAAALSVVLSSQSALAAPTSLALQVATHALSHASPLGATPSLIARLIQGAKSHALVTGIGAAFILAIGGIAVSSRREPESITSAATAQVIAVDRSHVASLVQSSGSSTAHIGPAQEAISERPAVDLVSAKKTETAKLETTFDRLDEEEKNILAILWSRQNDAARPPGTRPSLIIGRGAPNHPGIDPLVSKGLAQVSKRDQNEIFLTPAGLEFCAAHDTEVESHPILENRGDKPGLAGFSPQEKRLMRMLWLRQKNSPESFDANERLKIKPATPLFAAREPLAAKGLVEIEPKTGSVSLTQAGRVFCETNLAP